MSTKHDMIPVDSWSLLKQFTPARIAIGRTGVSMTTREALSFKADHAMARDAIYTPMETAGIRDGLQEAGISFIELKTKVVDRREYLLRPDKGRQLHQDCIASLKALHDPDTTACITIADGLSPLAVNRYAVPLTRMLISAFQSAGLRYAPVCIVKQGRVAVSDETGAATGASISIILIGERPGLSSPDSLGVYITYAPAIGKTDAERNCISNIRSGGLNLTAAAEKIMYLLNQALQRKLSGVELKETTNHLNDTSHE